MGLSKRIQLENGVTVNYHRIAKIEHIIGQETSLTIYSYTSQAKRREEKKQEIAEAVEPTQLTYIHDHWFARDYDDTLTVPKAYEWLKEQPEFEGAKDAIEDD